jgi:catechol 2,3-dioxygenase-like lactoylglutathione lyase family enzyme
MAVEIQQPRIPKQYSARTNQAGVLGIQHIGMAVRDLKEADRAFRTILDIPITGIRSDQHGGEQLDGRIEPGNDHLILHVTQSWGENARVSQFVKQKGQGLEHICIEVKDIRTVIYRLREKKIPIYDGKIFTDRDDGFETFVYPPYTTGITIEFIEPFPNSIGYRYTL